MPDSLVSIVIAACDVEPYISACLDSVITQTHARIEVIVVDDGSTDSTGAICDAYADQDKRIRVLHQAHAGVAEARNRGLASCTGQWVIFVDSDDYVASVFVECLLDAAVSSNCDIAVIPTGIEFADGQDCRLMSSIDQDIDVEVLDSLAVQEMLLYQRLNTGTPFRIFRRELARGLDFPHGLYFEDLAWVYRLVAKTQRIALLKKTNLYAIRVRPNSILHEEFSAIKAFSSIQVSRQLYADMVQMHPQLERAAASRCFSVNRSVYAQIPKSNKRARNQVWAELTRYRKTIVVDSHARKRERLAAAIACMGQTPFAAFCFLCRKMGLLR